MKKDKYLNFILTVIAINLTVLVLQNFNLIRYAQAGEIETNNQPIEVVIEEVDRYAFRYCTVPVEVDNTVGVNVENTVQIEGDVDVKNKVEVYCTNCE